MWDPSSNGMFTKARGSYAIQPNNRDPLTQEGITRARTQFSHSRNPNSSIYSEGLNSPVGCGMDSKPDRATIGRINLPNYHVSGAYKNIKLLHGALKKRETCNLLVFATSCGEAGLGKGTAIAENAGDGKSY